jgi:hypothetical protein
MLVTPQPKLFWIGVLLYLVSFFVVAVAGVQTSSGGPAFGFDCAFTTLLFSWEQVKAFAHGLHAISRPLEYFSFLVSGWINPLFLAFIVIAARGGKTKRGTFLRAAILLIAPFCWVVFYYEHLYPREGYFLWIIGILLALFTVN